MIMLILGILIGLLIAYCYSNSKSVAIINPDWVPPIQNERWKKWAKKHYGKDYIP